MSHVSIKDLSVSFGAVEVLKGLDLEIKSGEFLVLLGSSGCGKSTLLNCIAGLFDVSGGQIWIGGRNVTWDEPSERGIGMVFQSYALYPQMTVRGNLSFGLRNAGMPRQDVEKRVRAAAEILQIEALLDRRPAALSGGQRQRVAIGRALVRDVDVFLFDEPLSNLDAKLRSDLRVEINRLHKKLKNTMIYVTHDQIEALTLADRIAVMKSGRIQQLGPPSEIYNRPENLFVAQFVGSPQMNMLRGFISRHESGPIFSFADGKVPLGSYPGNPYAAREGTILGLRPEHFSVSRTQSGMALTGRVDLLELMGPDNIINVNIGAQTLQVRVASDELFDDGERVFLTADTTRASLFDAETERRI